MAVRGLRKLSIDDQIAKISALIEEKENELKELRAQKKELMEKKEKEDIDSLLLAIKASGKSIKEITDMIMGNK